MGRFSIACDSKKTVIFEGKSIIDVRLHSENDLKLFKKWIKIYNNADALDSYDNKKVLLELGSQIYRWIDRGYRIIAKAIEKESNPFIVEFCIDKTDSEIEKAFIEVPWEILAYRDRHLARTKDINYCPIRRIGKENPENQDKPKPSEYRLNTVFMAASPKDVKPKLDFEKKESAILRLNTEEDLDMDIFIEESGNIDQIVRLMHDKKPVDILHISCYGNILADPRKKSRNKTACIALEDRTGIGELITPDIFCKKLTQDRPALIFLSAYKTDGTYKTDKDLTDTTDKSLSSFPSMLIESGFRAVLGWSGSVGDKDEFLFTSMLYEKLSTSASIEDAVAQARLSLLAIETKCWHYARLYFGPNGGGIVSNGTKKRFDYEKDAGKKEFLGKKEKALKVANRQEFVGRKRHIQDILREFKEKKHSGVLIYGIGSLGKSSLAARVSERMQENDYETVLIYGKKGEESLYSALNILKEFESVNNTKAYDIVKKYIDRVADDKSYLKAALKELLNGPFSGKDNDHKPILMVIDGLEKILIPPVKKTDICYKVAEDFKAAIKAVILAFKEAETESRLLITSRYDFDLFDDSRQDIAQNLLKQPLNSMNNIEAEKQYFAKYREIETEKNDIEIDPEKVRNVAKGNPGLQDIMFNLFANNPQSYLQALKEIEKYRGSGEMPKEQTLRNFFEDQSVDVLIRSLSETEKEILRFAVYFHIPVPIAVFYTIQDEMVTEKNDRTDYIKRLVSLGILEFYEDLVFSDQKAVMVNRMVKTFMRHSSVEDFCKSADIVIESLLKSWEVDKGRSLPWVCDEEILGFALSSQNIEVVKNTVEDCLSRMIEDEAYFDAANIAMFAILLFELSDEEVSVKLYSIASDVCHRTGQVDIAIRYAGKALESENVGEADEASLFAQLGMMLITKGEKDNAEVCLTKARDLFIKLNMHKENAVASGEIAKIKMDKGEVDEVLELLEERLQAFDRLGDAEAKASVLVEIESVKELKEVMRLYEEKVPPNLPCNICDFQKIRSERYYYIDKTMLIEQIFKGPNVILITRPPRFGKTLNIDMLRCFFEKTSPSKKHLFKNLAISNYPDIMAEQGTYPVIYLSFKDLKEYSWEQCLKKLIVCIQKEYKRHDSILDSLAKYDKKEYIRILESTLDKNLEGSVDEAACQDSLANLTEYLYSYYKKGVMLLIDEYDTPIYAAYENGYYNKAAGFFSNMLSAALKDNSCLEKGILTGVFRIANESIFSGLNNLTVFSILENQFSDMFGFTQKETEKMLNAFGMQDKTQIVKKWYGGCNIGKDSVYNPWSIVNFIKFKETKPYWTNTSENKIIIDMLKENDLVVQKKIEALVLGESIDEYINENTVFDSLKDNKSLWSLLVFSGYLTILEKLGNLDEYRLKIPNLEAKHCFKKAIIEWIKEDMRISGDKI